MNDVFMNIYLRRAVRDYKDMDVPDELIKEIINAGTFAPSAMNKQPWRFVVIKGRDRIRRYSDRAKELLSRSLTGLEDKEMAALIEKISDPEVNIFHNAPVLILIFATPDARSPEYDCALAAENMMLAARSLGIGSCWIGLASQLGSDKGFLGEIGVPEGYRLIAPLIFGYPRELKQTAPIRNKDVIIKWIR